MILLLSITLNKFKNFILSFSYNIIVVLFGLYDYAISFLENEIQANILH